MATLLVPTQPSLPYQTSKVRLEGRDFVFHLAWNQRESRWYLSIHDQDDVPLVSGLKVLANWPLLGDPPTASDATGIARVKWYASNSDVPPGNLMAVDLTGDGSPPGIDELGPGLRCELTYFESTP